MADSQSTRAIALARRKALSTGGKGAMGGSSPQRTRVETQTATTPPAAATPVAAAAKPRARHVVSTPAGGSSRAVALARRKAMSVQGKRADTSTDRTATGGPQARRRAAAAETSADSAKGDKKGDCGCGCKQRDSASDAATAAPRPNQRSAQAKLGQRRPSTQGNPTRAAALARRKAQSTRGKAGLNSGGVTAAQTARAMNPGLTARELARELREMRSRSGKTGIKQKCGDCSGKRRQRPKDGTTGAASDQSWKVGASETSHGQTVTGTMVGRSKSVTGDEPSTCRAVTGTEYMGADIFRDFCQSEPAKAVRRTGVSPTARGNSVTGNEVGRSTKVTGDEPGTCKRVTGTEYVGAGQAEAFCGTRSEVGPAKISGSETRKGKQVTGNNVGRSDKVTGDEVGAQRVLTGSQYMQLGDNLAAPAKVGRSDTLRGGSVTGTMVGRHERMTGDEAGSCRNVTGDDYIGQEQFQGFCAATPAPKDQKVGVSQTFGGKAVSGTMTGRAQRVTGDEPGSCKAVTGTPYAGAEQYRNYCQTDDYFGGDARMRPSGRKNGAMMTGLQPSVGGKTTGDSRGACEPVSGTPYVGSDQVAAACPATAAEPGSPDFPQPLAENPWGQFSVASPMHAAEAPAVANGVTGSRYEQGQITGPFGKATGRVTGTEEARFGRRERINSDMHVEAPAVEGRLKTRVTGEGIDAGQKITGDDWDRGDRVTGTEGASALARNQTRRGPGMNSMAARLAGARNEELPAPVSKVTGGSGNTDKGALITYSGGARG